MSEPATRQPSLPPIEPGTVLAGKYRVERIIGQGGMGVVVEARHIALDEQVALKFLQPDFALHPEGAARFIREARAAVKIKSEHVARVIDVGTLDTGAPYMVMEFLMGDDLARSLEQHGVLSLDDAIDFVTQACEAIAEAHAYGIVHRDLKPANLFLTKRPDGSPLVKVLDFGISKVPNGGVENLTRTTAALGSALYMSPEQMQQTRSVDHRTDIYALGITLFELLAGRQPFYAETLPQLCAEVLTGTPTPLATPRPDIPDAFAAALQTAYARDRNQRYASIAEFVVALSPFAPARTYPTIDRIARMGGLSPSLVGVFGQRSSRPSYSAYTPPESEAPNLNETTPLPEDRPSPIPPSESSNPEFVGLHQIVPGPYSAPMSARAAATFASSTGTGLAATERSPLGWSTLTTVALVVAAMGFGAALWVLTAGRTRTEPPRNTAHTSTLTESPATESSPSTLASTDASGLSTAPKVETDAKSSPTTTAAETATPHTVTTRIVPIQPPARPPLRGAVPPKTNRTLDPNDPH